MDAIEKEMDVQGSGGGRGVEGADEDEDAASYYDEKEEEDRIADTTTG
jgi:hypothetical protein